MIFTHYFVVYGIPVYTGCQLTESIMVNHMQWIKVLLWYRLIYAWNTIYIRLWTLLRTTQISRSQNHGIRFSHFTLTQHFVCMIIILFGVGTFDYLLFLNYFLSFEMQRGSDTLFSTSHLFWIDSFDLRTTNIFGLNFHEFLFCVWLNYGWSSSVENIFWAFELAIWWKC